MIAPRHGFFTVAMFGLVAGLIWILYDDLPNAAMCISLGTVFLHTGAIMRIDELQDRLDKMESQNKEVEEE